MEQLDIRELQDTQVIVELLDIRVIQVIQA